MELSLNLIATSVQARLDLTGHDMPHNCGSLRGLDPGKLHKDNAPESYIRAEASLLVSKAMRHWHNQMVEQVAEALLDRVRREVWREAATDAHGSVMAGVSTIDIAGVGLGRLGDPLAPPTLGGERDDGEAKGK